MQISNSATHVVLSEGSVSLGVTLKVAIKMSQGLRIATKEALRTCLEPVSTWRSLTAEREGKLTSKPYTTPNKIRWLVASKGEEVMLMLGDNQYILTLEKAIRMSNELRSAIKSVKKYYGVGRSISVVATLTDANSS